MVKGDRATILQSGAWTVIQSSLRVGWPQGKVAPAPFPGQTAGMALP